MKAGSSRFCGGNTSEQPEQMIQNDLLPEALNF